MRRLAIAALLCATAAGAQDRAGAFDYWVLALSWTPTYCALEGGARDAEQCDRGLGWSLHGLWPQYSRGYPQWCDAVTRDPTRSETSAMADLMGSGGLAWYQWRKHGRCAGLDPADYFDAARRAYEDVTRPAVLRRLADPVRLPARVVEEAFLAENPFLFPDAITITCRDGRIQEARLCLGRDDLAPRRCGADVIRDCTLGDALLDPVD